jgi:hypothetical protein
MERDIAAAALICMGYQKGKVHKNIHLQPDHIPIPKLVSFSRLFTRMDSTTLSQPHHQWTVLRPSCMDGYRLQRFGVTTAVTRDKGLRFTASLRAAICRLLSISHVPKMAYHPQVERFPRRLKDSLRACPNGPDWHSHLPWVMLGIRVRQPELKTHNFHWPKWFSVLGATIRKTRRSLVAAGTPTAGPAQPPPQQLTARMLCFRGG